MNYLNRLFRDSVLEDLSNLKLKFIKHLIAAYRRNKITYINIFIFVWEFHVLICLLISVKYISRYLINQNVLIYFHTDRVR